MNGPEDKILRLPGARLDAAPPDFRKLAAELREAHDARVEFMREVARYTRQRYESFVAVGFTEAQALELCK